ncbi:MAG: S9 family peptidase [Cytophagaceae bacterium]|jgi:dipeptidyl aminopeptidase/acylaminoacyl peptidase|nr:S9 family peptidase [Cytophagaceae bacterium]
MKKILYITLVASLTIACTGKKTQEQDKSFDLKELKISGNRLTPEILWAYGRLGSVAVSPDNKQVVYTVSYANVEENRSYSDIYTVPVDGGEPVRLTETKANEFDAGWRPDGKKIAFLSAQSGEVQLWEMNPDGSNRRQMSNVEGGITGYKYSPDMSRIAYSKPVKLDRKVKDIYPDLPLANARIEDDLMYRHWDSWHDYHYNHVFVAAYSESTPFTSGTDILAGERFDAPTKPFGGMEQVAWMPDGKKIAYTCKKLAGKDYALSTNTDIYLYNIENQQTENMTEGMMGYDINPVFSPDGNSLAWESMERDGYEADKNRLFIMNIATREKKDYTEGFDQNVASPVWDDSGQFIWFTSNWHATSQIYLLNVESGVISKTTEGIHDFNTVFHAGNYVIATCESMSAPPDIFSVNLKENSTQNISRINDGLQQQLKMGEVEQRWVTTTDNKQMLVWVIYPPDFDPTKKYPALLYCQGGPQSGVSQFWSSRWNFQIMAANDYIIVAPNRRGVPGFGQAWNEQISGDYGGQNMKDYLTAIDDVAKEPFVDETRLGAVGASYGGYSVYWLAGNHNKRFKAFISHAGIFNEDIMYSTTEELFFVDWDLGGPYWKLPLKSYEFSPHRFVGNWDTPLLVIHGGKDFRIPYTQGMGAFNTALIQDIPARFLYFPEENHWVLQPQNGILWQREFFRWLNHWLK